MKDSEVGKAERMRVLVVCSAGGHLDEARSLVSQLDGVAPVWVVNQKLSVDRGLNGPVYYLTHAERDWRVLLNVLEAWRIVREVCPDAMISTGAGPAVPVALVCRALGIPVVFVECITQAVRPSLTGILIYPLANRFFFQWPGLASYFPDGECIGLLR